jgi:hypothetical protein
LLGSFGILGVCQYYTSTSREDTTYGYALGIHNNPFEPIACVRELAQSFLIFCFLATTMEGQNKRHRLAFSVGAWNMQAVFTRCYTTCAGEFEVHGCILMDTIRQWLPTSATRICGVNRPRGRGRNDCENGWEEREGDYHTGAGEKKYTEFDRVHPEVDL